MPKPPPSSLHERSRLQRALGIAQWLLCFFPVLVVSVVFMKLYLENPYACAAVHSEDACMETSYGYSWLFKQQCAWCNATATCYNCVSDFDLLRDECFLAHDGEVEIALNAYCGVSWESLAADAAGTTTTTTTTTTTVNDTSSSSLDDDDDYIDDDRQPLQWERKWYLVASLLIFVTSFGCLGGVTLAFYVEEADYSPRWQAHAVDGLLVVGGMVWIVVMVMSVIENSANACSLLVLGFIFTGDALHAATHLRTHMSPVILAVSLLSSFWIVLFEVFFLLQVADHVASWIAMLTLGIVLLELSTSFGYHHGTHQRGRYIELTLAAMIAAGCVFTFALDVSRGGTVGEMAHFGLASGILLQQQLKFLFKDDRFFVDGDLEYYGLLDGEEGSAESIPSVLASGSGSGSRVVREEAARRRARDRQHAAATAAKRRASVAVTEATALTINSDARFGGYGTLTTSGDDDDDDGDYLSGGSRRRRGVGGSGTDSGDYDSGNGAAAQPWLRDPRNEGVLFGIDDDSMSIDIAFDVQVPHARGATRLERARRKARAEVRRVQALKDAASSSEDESGGDWFAGTGGDSYTADVEAIKQVMREKQAALEAARATSTHRKVHVHRRT